MEVTVRTGKDEQAGSEEFSQKNLIVRLDKGGAGSRVVELERDSVRGKTYGEVAHMAVEKLGSDAWASDYESLLSDRNASLERISSGTQSHYVARDAPIDEEVAMQDEVRFSVAKDHTGGRNG